MQHLNWDNLRYVLMVANQSSIAAAARELGVNRTTVLRRINAFQESLNCRIFERADTGYILTPEAEKMIIAAREVEDILFNMQRQIAGRELKLEGALRVTTTDTFMVALLGPHLASFHRKHPHIVVEILTTNSILDLNRRDADVAIRPTRQPEANLVGRKIGDVEVGVYASTEYLPAVDQRDIVKQSWVGVDDSLRATPIGHWFDATINQAKITIRCDSFVAVKIAAENGLGLSLLPRFLGDSSNNLERLQVPTEELTTGLWLLTHPDLVRSAKVHAFIEHFSEALAEAL